MAPPKVSKSRSEPGSLKRPQRLPMGISSPSKVLLSITTALLGFVLLYYARVSDRHTIVRLSYFSGEGASGFSRNVSSCPGYELHSLVETRTGLSAQLQLAGPACNAFGHDVKALTIEVTYETTSRLHVNIYDTDKRQYTIPDTIINLPSPPSESFKQDSDLLFNYDSSPFAFWITRRSQPTAAPLFDTRISSLPPPSDVPVIANDSATALSGFPLVFEDQYLQLTSALPLDTNVYGLGEVVASSGFRRDIRGTVQTLWNRDAGDPLDENIYGSHPVYLEHRLDPSTDKPRAHGVFLFSAAGGDILLVSPPQSKVSLIQYRMIGGVLDFYFFSGPNPKSVIEQYGGLIGYPTWQPLWGFGFHLCRWGYANIAETREQVRRMREAHVPLEVMWNDIDLYHAFRDFTTDPTSFPASENSNHQRYIPIVDAAIGVRTNGSDIYDPYTRGIEKDVFMKNPDGSVYIGKVWPGYTTFPDWLQPDTLGWWTEALRNWTNLGVGFSGIWLDMNEASSFCDGSCGTGADVSDTSVPFALPGRPGNLITGYPECYDDSKFGPSGNITVNGLDTCQETLSLSSRGLEVRHQSGFNVNVPPYAIHNGYDSLSAKTIATNATHYEGILEYDIHNLWGLMEEKATHLALQDIHPGKRPFLISRSTYPSSGKWTGHWLGDNHSLWSYMKYSIAGVLQFQIFQIPFVGADTCGFSRNTDEELCNRWMQLSAFLPFYRNHNVMGALPQEPYHWDSVANASRTAIAIRYSLLPYWYTLFANASIFGTPPVRALFYEFPGEAELFAVDTQFFVGGDILVTPVLAPRETTVAGIFPGRGRVIWRDWYAHDVLQVSKNGTAVLSAPLGHVNVHIRGGAAILLYAKPAYTIHETSQGPFSLLVSQANDGSAFGTAYLDDGESYPPGPSRELKMMVSSQEVRIEGEGSFYVEQVLDEITILGVPVQPQLVSVNGKSVQSWKYFEEKDKLVVSDLLADLNDLVSVQWK